MKDRNALAIIGLVSAFAFSMLLTIGGLTIFGYMLDGWLGTNVIFTIIGGVFGIFTGVYNLIRQILKMEERNGKE